MNERIRRSPKNAENPFAQISREMLQDKTLSYEARGLISYLLSKSGNWELRVSDLQIEGAGRDKVYRIIGELQAKGYISTRAKFQDEKGYWQWTPYDVFETPVLSPYPENPYTVNPYTENTEIKEKILEDEIQNTKEEEKKKIVATPRADKSHLENPDGSVRWPDSDEVSVIRLEREGNSPHGESSTKRLTQTTQDKTPLSKVAPKVSPAPKVKSRGVLERVIIDQWQSPYTGNPCPIEGPKGVAAFLLPQMVGNASLKSGRAEFNFETPVTDDEVYAFGKWYRKHVPDTPMLMDAGKLAMRFEQFRTCEDYASRLRVAAHEVGILYKGKPKHSDTPAPKSDETTPFAMPKDHPLVQFFAANFPNEEQF